MPRIEILVRCALSRFNAVVALIGAGLVAACTNVGLPSLPVENPFATKVAFLTPARSSDAGALRSLVIVSGQPPLSQQVVGAIEAGMVKLRVNEQPYYAAARLETAGLAGAVPTEAALVALARKSGTQGALGVSGATVDFKADVSQEERQNCSVDTKLFKSCPKERRVVQKVNCTETVVLANAQLRVVRSADARTVFVGTMAGGSKHRHCAGDAGSVPADRNQLTTSALSDLVAQVMRTVAPSTEMRGLDLKAADPKIAGPARLVFDGALEFARAKRMDEACSRFEELYADEKESVALTYNVGFCHEVRGDLLRASAALRRASELNKAPDSQIDTRLEATEKALKENPVAFLPEAMLPVQGFAAPAAAQSDGRRVALVFGNARYQKNALVNPVNDGALVSTELKRIGFDVTTLENVDSGRMLSAIRDFAARARGAEMALFYYAGHATQSKGENILMPVNNLQMRFQEDVLEQGGVSLDDVVSMLDVSNPRVRLLVIDACRDNPLPSRQTGMTRSSIAGGLAPQRAPPGGTMIAFATTPGSTAEDGLGKNSTFTRHFAAELKRPNQTVEQLFKRVRENVVRETKNRQTPMEIGQLVGDVILVRSP